MFLVFLCIDAHRCCLCAGLRGLFVSNTHSVSVVWSRKTFPVPDRGHFHPTPNARQTKWQHADFLLYDRPPLMTRCILDFSPWPATCRKLHPRCSLNCVPLQEKLLNMWTRSHLFQLCEDTIYPTYVVIELPEKILQLIFTFAKLATASHADLVDLHLDKIEELNIHFLLVCLLQNYARLKDNSTKSTR